MQKDNKVKLSEQITMLSKASELLDIELKMLNKEFSGLNKNLDEIGVEMEKQKKGVEELDRKVGKELENVHRKKKELVNLKNKTREENIVETIQYIINILVILVISYIKNPIGFLIAILICLASAILKPIYESMLRNKLEISVWNYFQYLLPEVEPYNSWDKCLRVREALNKHGYKIKDINC